MDHEIPDIEIQNDEQEISAFLSPGGNTDRAEADAGSRLGS